MTGRNSSYKGDTYDGSFKLKIENFFEVPERIVVKSEEFEFCGYIFQAKNNFQYVMYMKLKYLNCVLYILQI
jgi:hypothetical protein